MKDLAILLTLSKWGAITSGTTLALIIFFAPLASLCKKLRSRSVARGQAVSLSDNAAIASSVQATDRADWLTFPGARLRGAGTFSSTAYTQEGAVPVVNRASCGRTGEIGTDRPAAPAMPLSLPPWGVPPAGWL
jgi:hypothetical protein